MDTNLAKECYRCFKKLVELFEEIDEKVEEFCDENGITLAFEEDRFKPIYMAEGTDYLMVYRAYKDSKMGYVVVTKNGEIEWKEAEFDLKKYMEFATNLTKKLASILATKELTSILALAILCQATEVMKGEPQSPLE